jgi:hypothetical protein
MAVCAAVAWIVLLPWAVHYYRETGRLSLTSSNGGMVAFISLGQLPNNPWAAVAADEYAYAYLRRHGIAAPAESDTGNRILFGEYLRRIKEHPDAFVARIAWNAAATLLSGFYGGEVPLSREETQQFTTLRQRFKESLFHARFVERSPEATIAPRVWTAFAYWVTAKTIGVLFVIISTVGLALSLSRQAPSRILLLLGTIICYQWFFLLALLTEPRFLNGLFPAYVPFFIVACAGLVGRLPARVRRQIAVP